MKLRQFIFDGLYQLPKRFKQAVFVFSDMVFVYLSVVLALGLRLFFLSRDFALSAEDYLAITICAIVSLVIFYMAGFYRTVVRHMGQQGMIQMIRAITISALVLALCLLITRSEMPRSIPFLYWFLALFFMGGTRLFVRSLYMNNLRKKGLKVAIYGAGATGRHLLNALHGGAYTPVAFIDDALNLHGQIISGVRVYPFSALEGLIDDLDIDSILLALPAIDRARRREIIADIEPLALSVKTVPSFDSLVSGLAKLDDLKDIELEDLLGRSTVAPVPELLSQCITNKVVMVTGAGGSIGSELCRQLISERPRELILLDTSEYNLYQIHRELIELALDVELTPLLGSVRDREHIKTIFTEFRVQTVYHSAAYKHVPLVEHNIAEGIMNNVFGTLDAGKAAVESKVETFVLISTDKAVRPSNVMGASKRMAEMVLQALAKKYCDTRFCMVRFGNVLGSSGSVVPLFREQIKQGGPVTVTHKDVVRYFMTIPEAAQLVLQAGSLGEGGDVFVLDMGDPIKIVDLARRMIHLMGYEVESSESDEDAIEIVYIGLRPGEKLYEELLLGDNVIGTEHPMIMRAEEEFLSEALLDRYLGELKIACKHYDSEALQDILLSAVTGFTAKDGISDAIWARRLRNQQTADEASPSSGNG